MDKPAIKAKRQLTPEQLEKLAKAREKANEARRKNYEIKKFEREHQKEQKHHVKTEKEKKRDQAVEAIIELKKEKQEKQEKAKAPPPPPEKESEDSEAEEYSESEDEKYAPTIRKVQTTKPPLPPPNEFKRRVKIIKPKEVKEEPESELYSKANIEILRNKLYQQTRQRLIGDLFNY